jgi:hypothetical protein
MKDTTAEAFKLAAALEAYEEELALALVQPDGREHWQAAQRLLDGMFDHAAGLQDMLTQLIELKLAHLQLYTAARAAGVAPQEVASRHRTGLAALKTRCLQLLQPA